MADIYDPDAPAGPSPAEIDQQLADLKNEMRELMRPFAPAGMPVDEFIPLALWARDNPDESKRMRQEAGQKLDEAKAARAQLRESYDRLLASYQSASDEMTAEQRYKTKALLHQLHAKLQGDP